MLFKYLIPSSAIRKEYEDHLRLCNEGLVIAGNGKLLFKICIGYIKDSIKSHIPRCGGLKGGADYGILLLFSYRNWAVLPTVYEKFSPIKRTFSFEGCPPPLARSPGYPQ